MDNSRLRREQDILDRLENVKRLIQMETTIMTANGAKKYLEEYSEYGMDDVANDLIGVQATLEVVRLKAQYAMIKGE